MFLKIMKKQGEKIIELDQAKNEIQKKYTDLAREHLTLTGMLDDAEEEMLFILDKIKDMLEINNYGNPEVKIGRVLEYVRQQIDIIEKDLDIEKDESLPKLQGGGNSSQK